MKTVFAKLVKEAEEEGMEYLLIGGLAVGALGFDRFTADIDLLTSTAHLRDWREFLGRRGYSIFSENPNFLQCTAPEVNVRVDLMLVSPETYEKLAEKKVEHTIAGKKFSTPEALKLIALKLFATRSNRARVLNDWRDIEMLIRRNDLDVKSERVRDIFLRYADQQIYEHFVKRLAAS